MASRAGASAACPGPRTRRPTRSSTRRSTRPEWRGPGAGMGKAVSSGVQEARRLVAYRGREPVISLFLDLDPERFATAPARTSQIRSLLDSAAKEIESEKRGLSHEQRVALR